MADRKLENRGSMDGSYNGTQFEDSLSSLVEVTLPDIPFEKSADQSVWFSGNLTLTFTIDNRVGEGPLDDIVITDLLDNTKFRYIANSVTIQISTTDDPPVVTNLVLNTDFTVNYIQNTPEDNTKDSLTIAFVPGSTAATIPIGSIATISFLGSKVPVTP